ncbi:hypothetical protein [Thioalkalivibrio sp. AKL7]|uniref:hypothetical protein n=1 Tax=Thioalkalivibrio sp. AKL7 TaxID=1158155 RepID=UPI0018CBC739|nr:hypothetical protein [Thioalkalivibrio sp. AKL7]
MAMVGLGTVGQHAGALGRKWIEGLWLGWRFALTGGQAPVEAAEGNAGCPGEQSIKGRRPFSIFTKRIIGLLRLSNYLGRRLTVLFRKAIEFKGDIINLALNIDQLSMNSRWIKVSQSLADGRWQQKSM